MTEYYVTGKWPVYLKSEARMLEDGEILEFPEEVNVERLLELGAVIENVPGMIIAGEDPDDEDEE